MLKSTTKSLWAQPIRYVVKKLTREHHQNKGVYKLKVFTENLEKRHYTISYSGLGSHEQTGVVERAI